MRIKRMATLQIALASTLIFLLLLHNPRYPTWWFCTSQEYSYTTWHSLCAHFSTTLYMLFGAIGIWSLALIVIMKLFSLYFSTCITKQWLHAIKIALGISLLSVLDAHFALYTLKGIPAGGIVGWHGILLLQNIKSVASLQTLLFVLSTLYALAAFGWKWAHPIERFITSYHHYIITHIQAYIQQLLYALRSKLMRKKKTITNQQTPHSLQAAKHQATTHFMPQQITHNITHNNEIYQRLSLKNIFGTSTAPIQHSSLQYTNKARILEKTLCQFDIQGVVTEITIGPVIVLYKYQLKKNTAINSIKIHEYDLIQALQVPNIRIIAPTHEGCVVSFECIRQDKDPILFNSQWNCLYTCNAQLPLLFGVMTNGQPHVIDLTALPHLLIVGSTGTGKSSILNTMIISLLITTLPKNLKLILIDPKRLEFIWYNDIAHLLFPIITDLHEAIKVLDWLVEEMERRYTVMTQATVTNSNEYHATGNDDMPNIVMIIDELAELMTTGGKEVENYIIRLTQMAQTAGIYVICATQYSSLDILTEPIKVNIPARIACRVTSHIDSHTILGVAGAETLEENGDMLVIFPNKSIERMHGIYISNQEIQMIICAIRRQSEISYTHISSEEDTLFHDILIEDLPFYKQTLEIIRNTNEVSISLLQRRLHIGYNRSVRIIDYLEARGMIFPSESKKTKKALRNE